MPSPTKQCLNLIEALKHRSIDTVPEYWDGHKHVDIYIPQNDMYIEIEGIQHFIDPHQIIADFKRDYYSNSENHFTFRVTNQLIESHLQLVADAIAKVVQSKEPLIVSKASR